MMFKISYNDSFIWIAKKKKISIINKEYLK
jgi:hypothetical protein